MRILVTGGSGRIGSATVNELLAHGHQVVNADQKPLDDPETSQTGAYQFRFTDLTDVGQVAGALAGCDAVIHLGAIPSPGRHADEVVFGNNVRGTFAVLHAAELLGVRKAVIASSLSALGTAWAPEPFPPRYAPVDEAHPLLNHDCYGLSKEVDERTAEMFHRRTGMQIVAFRFSLVAPMDQIRRHAASVRERPGDPSHWRVLWAYVDVRDAATACRLGVEASSLGFEVFTITAADTLSETPTEELLRRHTPSVEIRQPIPGTASASPGAPGRPVRTCHNGGGNDVGRRGGGLQGNDGRMVDQQQYTPEEWALISGLPVRVAIAAAIVEGGEGLDGSREMLAAMKEVASAEDRFAGNALIQAILAELKQEPGEEQDREIEIGGGAAWTREIEGTLAQCREAAALVEAKADPEEAAEYRRWLVEIAGQAVAATKSGGFLGIGGELVTDQEKTFLVQLANALGTNPDRAEP